MNRAAVFEKLMATLFLLGLLVVFGSVGASDAGAISSTRMLIQAAAGFAIVFLAGRVGGFFRKSEEGEEK